MARRSRTRRESPLNGLKANDILVKVLLCEDEATLPIKSDVEPYYHWNDFKAYCLEKLKEYKN